LPIATLRFAPVLDATNRAPRAFPLVLPAVVERPEGAAATRIVALSVEASFDDGSTWSAIPGFLVGDAFFGLILHPPRTAFVSLRGTARDAVGNEVTQTLIRAYGVTP